MNKKMIWLFVLIIVIAGGSFYAGDKYGVSSAPTGGSGFAKQGINGMGVQRGAGSRAGFGVLTSGDILSMDAQSITLSLRAGGSKIVFYTDKTSVVKMASGTTKDLSVGTSISVTGTANADGSMNADSIQIRPAPAMGTATPTPNVGQ